MTSPTNLARESESITRLSNVLLRHVVPLFKKALGKRPSLVGNGLLVSSGRSSFLVSAAHVFDEHSQLHFYVEPGVISKLNGRLLRTKLPTTGHRLDDRVDIGVLRLDGEALPPYKKMDKFALPISALRPHALPRENKQYLVVGFPATKSKANPAAQELKSEPVSFRNIAASTSKESLIKYASARGMEQGTKNLWLKGRY